MSDIVFRKRVMEYRQQKQQLEQDSRLQASKATKEVQLCIIVLQTCMFTFSQDSVRLASNNLSTKCHICSAQMRSWRAGH